MDFIWPNLLWLLLLIPLVVYGWYTVIDRKKRKAEKYASLAMVRDAMGSSPAYKQYVPAILILIALILMITAVARPVAVVTLPSQRDTILLAMDISGSMRAVDVEPDRISVSREAVKTFISEQPASTRVGIVAFAGTAMMVQQPTLDRGELTAAVDRFQLQQGTNIGSALLVSLQEIFPDADIIPGDDNPPPQDRSRRGRALGQLDELPETEEEEFEPVEPGSYSNAAIILLTDGQSTTGPDPLEIAQIVADRGVRVFTVGLGTVEGETVGYGGMSMRVQLDEETLRRISEITHGRYFNVGSETELTEVYRELTSQFVMETQEMEITVFFAGVAAALMFVSALLSLLWFTRII